MDWKEPFSIAGELALAIVGWSLVLIVGMFGILLAVAFAKAIVSIFVKKPGKKKSPINNVYDSAIEDLQKAKNFRIVKDDKE